MAAATCASGSRPGTPGDFKSRSIKYAYRDKSGKVSRGCPELPFDVLVEMVIVALKQKELTVEQVERLKYHLR